MGPEKRIEQRFSSWCRDQGLFCLKLQANGVVGFPDRTVLLPGGRCIFIEFKSPDGKLRATQAARIDALRRLGHSVLVTHEFNEAVEFVKQEKVKT